MTIPRLTPERLAAIRQINEFLPGILVTELLAELDAVTRERDEARKDTARIDWLQNDQGRAVYPGAVWGKPWACGERAYSELRTAIDDGMSWPKPPHPIMPHTPGRSDASRHSSDSAASNEGGKPEGQCCKIVSFGAFCEHPKGHTGPCETGVLDA